MLQNELDLIKKILSDAASNYLKFNHYASSSGINYKILSTAHREIKIFKSDGKISFEYKSGRFNDQNTLSEAYALMYRKCPSDNSYMRHYYFGDISIRVKNKKLYWNTMKKFQECVKAPKASTLKLPTEVNEFCKAFYAPENLQAFWNFIETEHQNILQDTVREGIISPKNYSNLFIHFDMTDFIGHTQWYNLDGVVEVIDNYELEVLGEEKKKLYDFAPEVNRYVINKKFYHTVGSGDKTNDLQFMDFDLSQRYKSFCFSPDDRRLCFYYSKVLQACNVRIPFSFPYFFRLIPFGEHLDATSILEFITTLKGLSSNEKANEKDIKAGLVNAEENLPSFEEEEDLAVDDSAKIREVSEMVKITSFDLILIRKDRTEINLSEVTNIARSTLRHTAQKICAIVEDVKKERNKKILSVASAFYSLHKTKNKKDKAAKDSDNKYKARLSSMMLNLYRGQYYGDQDLERVFVEKITHSLRDDPGNDQYYDNETFYILLTRLAKEKPMAITSEDFDPIQKSFELGRLVAKSIWALGQVINGWDTTTIGHMSITISGPQALTKAENLLVRSADNLKFHVGKKVGAQFIGDAVIPDNAAYATASDLIDEFRSKGVKLISLSFCRGFYKEYHRQLYFMKKN